MKQIAVKNKSFYANGRAGDIEMPPLGYQLPDPNSPAQPQEAQSAAQSTSNPAFSVPDQVDAQTLQHMQPEHEQPETEQLEVEHEDEMLSEQEVEESETESFDEPEHKPVTQVAKAPVKKQEENFKAIREAKERAEKERDLLFSKLLELQQAQQQPKIQPEIIEPQDPDLDFNVNDDDLLEGKHAKKLIAELKKMKSEIKTYKNQNYQTSIEAKIKSNFPDFDQVVSQENVSILNQEFPELAASLRDTADMYNKAASAYSVIKRYGIYKEPQMYVKEKEIALTNAKKPRPLASVSPQQGNSPLSKANAFANGLTDELKEQMRKEMFDAMKRN